MNQTIHTQWTLNCGFSPAVVYTFLLLCLLEMTNELAILVHEAVNYLCLLLYSVLFLHQTSFILSSKAHMLPL
jgi:hypothetical protein